MSARKLDTEHFISKYSEQYHDKFQYANFVRWVRDGLIPAEKHGNALYFDSGDEKWIDQAVERMITRKRPVIKQIKQELIAEGWTKLVQVEKREVIRKETEEALLFIEEIRSKIDSVPEGTVQEIEKAAGINLRDLADHISVLFEIRSLLEHLVIDVKQTTDKAAKDSVRTEIYKINEHTTDESDRVIKYIHELYHLLLFENRNAMRVVDQFVGRVSGMSKVLNPLAIPVINEAKTIMNTTKELSWKLETYTEKVKSNVIEEIKEE